MLAGVCVKKDGRRGVAANQSRKSDVKETIAVSMKLRWLAGVERRSTTRIRKNQMLSMNEEEALCD